MKPKFINAVYITLAQIIQMVAGIIVTGAGCYLLWFDKEVAALKGTPDQCQLRMSHVSPVMMLYASYLFLFSQFFVRRYIKNYRSSREDLAKGVKKIV